MTGFLALLWGETSVWWHRRRRDAHAAALVRLEEEHRARVLSWTVGGYHPDPAPVMEPPPADQAWLETESSRRPR